MQLVILIFLFNLCSSEQDVAVTYVENSLKYHIYYFLDFEKDSIPESKIYVSDEIIPSDISSFSKHENFPTINIKNNLDLKAYETEVNNQHFLQSKNNNNKYDINSANYIMFFSNFKDGLLTARILFKKDKLLTKSYKYSDLSSFNSGVKYLFYFKGKQLEKVIVSGFSNN